MNILLEAIKELRRESVNEQFKGYATHYLCNLTGEKNTIIIDGEEYKANGHVAPSLNYFERVVSAKIDEDPLFIGLSETRYVEEAEELARADAANIQEKSTHTGIECFIGGKADSNKNYIYKIRWASKFANKKYLNSFIDGFDLFGVYNEHYKNPSGEYCDVVIYTGYPGAKAEPNIVTFYVATKEAALELIKDHKRYNDDESIAHENDIDARMIVIENKDNNGKLFGANSNSITPYHIPSVIVVKAQAKNNKTTHGKKDGSLDDNFKYISGSFIDPKTLEEIKINVDTDMGNKDVDRSSRVISTARETFEKAFWRKYAELRNFTYRKSTVENMPVIWATSPDDAIQQIRSDTEIVETLRRWGMPNKKDNFREYNSVIKSLEYSIKRYWD